MHIKKNYFIESRGMDESESRERERERENWVRQKEIGMDGY